MADPEIARGVARLVERRAVEELGGLERLLGHGEGRQIAECVQVAVRLLPEVVERTLGLDDERLRHEELEIVIAEPWG